MWWKLQSTAWECGWQPPLKYCFWQQESAWCWIFYQRVRSAWKAVKCIQSGSRKFISCTFFSLHLFCILFHSVEGNKVWVTTRLACKLSRCHCIQHDFDTHAVVRWARYAELIKYVVFFTFSMKTVAHRHKLWLYTDIGGDLWENLQFSVIPVILWPVFLSLLSDHLKNFVWTGLEYFRKCVSVSRLLNWF